MMVFNPVTASQVVGLGTAAVKNTGTSGDAVPVLNGAATTWTNGATFGGNLSGTTLRMGGSPFASNDANYNYLYSLNGTVAGYINDAVIYWDRDGHDFRSVSGGTTFMSVNATGIDVTGLARCDTLRIDAAPTAETPPATHTAVINLNGTNYKFLCLAA